MILLWFYFSGLIKKGYRGKNSHWRLESVYTSTTVERQCLEHLLDHDMGSSGLLGLVMAPGRETNKVYLGLSFRSSIK